jgi:hypothetical protein
MKGHHAGAFTQFIVTKTTVDFEFDSDQIKRPTLETEFQEAI